MTAQVTCSFGSNQSELPSEPGIVSSISLHQTAALGRMAPGRKQPDRHDKRRYRHRSRIEIMFGRLKDWWRVATRYDRCPTAFLSAVALAATVIFWLLKRVLTLGMCNRYRLSDK